MRSNHLTGTMWGSISFRKTSIEDATFTTTWLSSTICRMITIMVLGTRMRILITKCQILITICIWSTRDQLSLCTSLGSSLSLSSLDTLLLVWNFLKKIILSSWEKSTVPPLLFSNSNNSLCLSMVVRLRRCPRLQLCTQIRVSKWLEMVSESTWILTKTSFADFSII